MGYAKASPPKAERAHQAGQRVKEWVIRPEGEPGPDQALVAVPRAVRARSLREGQKVSYEIETARRAAKQAATNLSLSVEPWAQIQFGRDDRSAGRDVYSRGVVMGLRPMINRPPMRSDASSTRTTSAPSDQRTRSTPSAWMPSPASHSSAWANVTLSTTTSSIPCW